METSWTANPPAADTDIEMLKRAAPIDLPEGYLAILRRYNGGEGELALPPMWLQLWSVQEVIENMGSEFYLTEFPGYFFIASNGGMELIAIRELLDRTEIVMVDPISGEESAEVIAKDFRSFEKAIGRVYEE